MTDKQIEAIERCNELIKDEHKEWIGLSNQHAIETVLNLLEKQKKQIERLEKTIDENIVIEPDETGCHEELNIHIKDFISKDTIREEIQELQKKIADNDKTITECRKTIMENQPEKKCIIAGCRIENVGAYETIKILKKLLGE